MLMQAHQRTKGGLLGEANHDIWAEEVVQNLPVVSGLVLQPDVCVNNEICLPSSAQAVP